MTLDVGFGALVNDNAGLNDPSLGTTTEATTSLGFGLISETRVSQLSFGLDTALIYKNEPGADGEFDLRAPNSRLSYKRTGANSLFEVTARYVDENLDDRILTFEDENFQPVDLIVDGGTLRRLNGSAVLDFGLDAPFGLRTQLTYDRRDYIDTVDPDLFDRTNVGVSTVARLRFSDVMTGTVSASLSRFEADSPPPTEPTTERTRSSVGVGLIYEISPRTTLSGNLSLERVETTDFAILTRKTEGLGFSFAAVTEMQNGTLGGEISRTVNSDGERTQISFDRAMELPRGSLSFGLGYSFNDEGDDAVLANLAFTRDLPDGSISANLSQQTRSFDEDEPKLFTRLGVTYNREINSVSDLTVDFGLGRTEDLSGVGDDSTRANLSVSYSRELTREWDWTLGYRRQYFRENADPARNSNVFFTRIDRSFSLRP